MSYRNERKREHWQFYMMAAIVGGKPATLAAKIADEAAAEYDKRFAATIAAEDTEHDRQRGPR